jgi:acetyl-CoA acetyltransferase
VSAARIVGVGRSPYRRHPVAGASTERILAEAALDALADAGLRPAEVDGFAVTSFTLGPDHAIDLAWRLGLKLGWIGQDTNGGAAGINMLLAAIRAVEAGDATTILLLGGDRLLGREVIDLQDGYNKATRDHLALMPFGGPNAEFSMLTQRHMAAHGLEREDYGRLAIAQRAWAAGNPGAVYRRPLTLEEYLAAPPVAPPLHRYDCPPIVSGADALLVTAADRVAGERPAVAVRAIRASFNWDGQEGDGLATGLAEVAPQLWEAGGIGPADVDLACIYDDYPVMALIQLADLGLVPGGDVKRFVARSYVEERAPINTSGGMLSAGQAGGGAALLGLAEAVAQLRGEAGERQVPDARTAVVSGYGMVVYRHGAAANAAILERAG